MRRRPVAVAEGLRSVPPGCGALPELLVGVARLPASLAVVAWLASCSATPTTALPEDVRPDPLPPNEARAIRLGARGPWVKHEMAIARSGDVLLENELVRFYVKGDTVGDGYVPYAGWILDAALGAGFDDDRSEADYDGVDGFYPLVNMSPIEAADVVIERDGADGERAVVVVSGPLRAVHDALSVQGAQPRPFDADVRIEYSLGPSDRALAIQTFVTNTSGEAQAVDIGDVILFGDDEADPFTVPGGFDRRAGLTAVDAVGSAHETRSVSYAVYASTPLSLLRGSRVRDQIGGDGSLVGYTIASGQLDPGAALEGSRWLGVAPDVGSALQGRFHELGLAVRPIAGEVLAAGARVAGARVSVFADPDRQSWVTQAISGEDGRFELSVPDGSYSIVATGRTTGAWLDDPDAPRRLAEGYTPSELRNVLVGDQPPGPIQLSLGPPARVRLDLRDTAGALVPGKITFLAEDPRTELCVACGERALHDWLGVRQVAWTAGGTAELALESGVYTITASHGPNAELDVRQGVSLPPGVLTELSLRIDEPIQHEGYVAIDPHVHGVFSQHGEATGAARVITAIAEGLDVQVATDHDTIADYTPALRRLGLERELLGIAGVEFETVNGDHCAWPLSPAPSEPFGGARRWWLDGREVADMYRYYTERGAIVMSVAHGASHFANAGYDTATGAVADASRFSFDFNAMEVHNGGGSGGRGRLVPIWMSLINFGHRVAPLAGSDSHGRGNEVGMARTYVRVGEGPLTAERVARATAALHTVASTGPFIELSSPNGSGPGDTLAVDAGAALELRIAVWAPSWMPIDEVRLWANGAVIERWDATTEPAVERRAGRALWFEHRLSVQPSHDSWYAVDTTGSKDLAPVNPGSHPWALTAPLFVDTDGDGEVSLPR
jgi:hypothetical protein